MKNQQRLDEGRSVNSPENVLYKKDFWSTENLKYSRPHFRMEKIARTVNSLAKGKDCTLLDVGCGPAALEPLVQPNIEYYGIDIALAHPAPNLIEADIVEAPIRFADKRFDIVLAQGFFEYVGGLQEQKFAEIRQLLKPDGKFVVSYVNFSHRDRFVYHPYSNVQPFSEFRASLERHFKVRRAFPTSYNWRHQEPSRSLVKAGNMLLNVNIPFLGQALAVEYVLICTADK
jgi:SAM-dependent methyltransferase